MKKLAITLSDEDFAMLEDLCRWETRTQKSKQIAWLILQEWEQLQKDKPFENEMTPDEIVKGLQAYEAAHAPIHDPRIIQFPVRQIRQFSGSA